MSREALARSDRKGIATHVAPTCLRQHAQAAIMRAMNNPAFPAALRDELHRGLTALASGRRRIGAATARLPGLAGSLEPHLQPDRDPRPGRDGDPAPARFAGHASLPRHLGDGGGSLADLGTGPGLPGIPLAIAKPQLQVTLVESNGKKARFLREAVRTLGLGNARVAESRAEALRRTGRLRRHHRARAGHAGRDHQGRRTSVETGRKAAGNEGSAAGRGNRRLAGRLDGLGRTCACGSRPGRRTPSGRRES